MRQPGDRVGRYVLGALLGRGGMGEVYEAEDTLLGRRVALKLVPSGEATDDARDRMLREARAAAAFDHPNAVLVLDVGVSDDGEASGATYLAMEFVPGRTMRAYVGAAEPDRARRVRWLVEAARALAAAHTRGLIHRDVKPDNLMVREDGVLKVLDFGIAKRSAATVDASAPTEAGPALATLTQAGAVVGTPRYASPEQLRGEALDGRSDQFSWGVTAYELLSGRPPFDATDTVPLISQVLGKDPTPLGELAPGLPPEVASAVMRALSKRPEDRFESLEDAASALQPFAEVAQAQTRREETAAAARPTRHAGVAARSARWLVYAAAAFGAAVAAGLVVAAATGHLKLDVGTPAKPSASAPPASAPSRLACSPASVEGAPAGVDLAAAVGVGTCARVAIELGVPWGPAGGDVTAASPVDVQATFGPPARVVVGVGGRRATGEAPHLLEAMRSAARALAADAPAPEVDPARRAAWGAPDAASARRIEATWRRLVMDDLDDSQAEIRALVTDVPTSPWSHAMLAVTELAGSTRQKEAISQALTLAPALPPARSKGLRGLLLFYRTDDDRPEGLRLMRQAYQEDPDDPDMAGLYAALAIGMDALDEGFAVVDRVVETSPTFSIVPLRNAIGGPRVPDPARNARYLARLVAVFPEEAARGPAFREALRQIDFGRAQEVLDFRAALLGPEEPADFFAARLALLRGDVDEAQEIAKRSLAFPVPTVRNQAGLLVAAAHFLRGDVARGHRSSLAELDRLRDEGNSLPTQAQIFVELRTRRRSGEPVPKEVLAAVREPMGILEFGLPVRIGFAVEVELARPKGPSRAATLALLERAASAARRHEETTAALSLLALVREVRGDKAAAELWDRCQATASESVRSAQAFDAALALEAERRPTAEVVAAYKAAMDPFRVETRPLDYLFAALRLGAAHPSVADADARARAVVKRRQALPPSLVDRALSL